MMTRRALLSGPVVALARPLPDEESFVALFDGRSLDGWTVREGPESAFYVRDGAITIHEGAGFPAWLRSSREYENFDFRCEFYLEGWSDSGIFLHAPEHGRNTWCGFQIKLFHHMDSPATPQSMGSIFPVVAPQKVNVRQKAWNELRVLFDWPSLKVWTNGELVQDLDVDAHPALRHRLRSGYLGISSLEYPLRFRNLRIRELPSKARWRTLHSTPADLEANWRVSEGEPNFQALGSVLRADGLGHIASKEKYADFALQMYVRGARYHNGGVLFRTAGAGNKGQRYEIQLHSVEDAHFPTGSLYGYRRAIYPRIEHEQWYLFQLFVQGKSALVRINGENVMEYGELAFLDAGYIELQAHRKNYWTEYKKVLVRPL